MLAIKLKPIGKKHQRSFRIVIQQKKSKLVGSFIEDLGWYNPHTNKYEINKERAEYWIGVGASPTMTVAQILKKGKIKLPEGIKTSKTYTKNKKAVAETPVAAPAAPAPTETAPAAPTE